MTILCDRYLSCRVPAAARIPPSATRKFSLAPGRLPGIVTNLTLPRPANWELTMYWQIPAWLAILAFLFS
jgi:hypothetical protein